jgi:gliding motility-associated-like protein
MNLHHFQQGKSRGAVRLFGRMAVLLLSQSVVLQAQTDTIRLYPATLTVPCNSIVDLPVHASRFRGMLSMQGTISWDTATLRFDSISGFGPTALALQASNFGQTQNTSGRLFFSWNDPALRGVSLPDSATLFVLRFTVRATAPTSTGVTVGGGIVPLELLDSSYATLIAAGATGQVSLPFRIPGFNPFADTTRVCGAAVTLDAGAGYSQYTWSNGSTLRTADISVNGTYSVSVRNTLGCTATDMTILSLVRADILNGDTTVCKGTPLTLRADTLSGGGPVCQTSDLSSSLRTGLRAFYPFCGNTNDISGNANHGNGTGIVSANDRYGHPNAAYVFSAPSHHIRLPFAQSNVVTYTVSAWFRTTAGGVIMTGRGSNGEAGLSVQVTKASAPPYAGRLQWVAENNFGAVGKMTVALLNDGRWHHFVGTFASSPGTVQPSQFSIYIDGVLVPTDDVASASPRPMAPISNNNTPLMVGNHPLWQGAQFQGSLDDIGIWERLLTPADVSRLQDTVQRPNWTYRWSTGQITPSIGIRPDSSLAYVLRVTDGITTCTDTLRVTVAPVDTSLTAIGPSTFCRSRDSLLLRAASAAGWQWLRNGSPIAGANSATYRPDSTGIYRAVLRNTLGCTDTTRAVGVTVNELPVPRLLAGGDSLLCEGGSRLLTAAGGATYRWYRNDTLVAGVTGDSLTATATGRYSLEAISTAGCIARADTFVTLTLLRRARLDFDITGVCVDVPIRFTNRSTIPSIGGVSWRWAFGNGDSSILASPEMVYRSPGNYRVLLRYANARCPAHSDTLSKALAVIRERSVRFADQVAVKDIAKPVFARDTASAWQWRPVTGLSVTNTYAPVATLQQNQQYVIQTTLRNGCIVYDTLLVKVAAQAGIHVPKAFSPNGDGQNDRLFPVLVGISQLKYFRVFNRWGVLVYEARTSGTGIGWDGVYRGTPQPMETYVWVAEAVDANGRTLKAGGNTILIR